jgi:membrane protease YdiL (CAAX protease family)
LALFWVWLVGRAEALPHRRVPPSAWLGTFLLTLGALPLGSALELLVARWVGQPTTTGLLVAEVARRSSALELAALYGAIAILPGIAEELLFRGVTLRLLLERSRAEALLISSLYFALAHLEPAQAAGTLVLGLAFGFARIATGSVLPAVVAHALNNALVLTVAVLLPEEAFSDQELSLPALLVGTAMVALGARILTPRGSRP